MTDHTTSTVHTVIDSPIGALTLVATDGVLGGLYMEEPGHRPAAIGAQDRDAPALTHAAAQLDAYFAGQLTSFSVEYELAGTPFQRTVWDALTAIPYGETITYGELARRIGQPSASRAVGLANGRNPLSIIVPCHRVIGANGTLTGYGGGVARKRVLLELERERAAPRLDGLAGAEV